MKEKIAFPQLVELVAAKAGTTSRMSELFLQELFATMSQTLVEGKKVQIKGLGVFELSKDHDGERNISFIPESSLAETVNSPFSQFKPVELCEEITLEQLQEIDNSMEPQLQEDAVLEPVKEEPTANVEKEVPIAEKIIEAVAEVDHTPYQEPHQVVVETSSIPSKKKSLKWLIAGCSAAAAIALIAIFAWNGKDAKKETATIARTHSIKPAPVVVVDTLTGNNVLTRMAKKHYGDQAFWVYIARENQQQYPNYRHIPRGATIVIPPAEKYGINSDSKQSLRRAYAEIVKLRNELKTEEEKTDSTSVTTKGATTKRTKTYRQPYKTRNKSHFRSHRYYKRSHYSR